MGDQHTRQYQNSRGGDAVYGLGLIGALIFYLQQAEGFLEILLAILQAFVWPAFVVYDLLKSFA